MRRVLGDGIELDDDRARIDLGELHAYLSTEAYWAIGRSLATVEQFVGEARRVVGLYEHDRLVGFARVTGVSERSAYLADVYVLPHLRGRGLGLELVREAVDRDPHGYTTWLLHTTTAAGLYERLGFGPAGATLLERRADDGSA